MDSTIPHSCGRHLNRRQKEAPLQYLQQGLKVDEILRRLRVAVPPDERVQWQVLRDFFQAHGADEFLERMEESSESKRPDSSNKKKSDSAIRKSTTLPKILTDSDKTQRKREKKQQSFVRITGKDESNSSSAYPVRSPEVQESEKTDPVDDDGSLPEWKEKGLFGPPTDDWDGMTDRRSGEERRKHSDRRQKVDLIYQNKRFGRDRRSGKDRRKN